MAAPSAISTIARVAEILRQNEEWLDELAEQLELEHGCLWVYDTEDLETIAFTERGVESLKERIVDQNR